MINKTLISFSVITLLVCCVILLIYPEIDLQIMGYFYETNGGFIQKDHIFTAIIYYSVPYFTKLFVACSAMFLLLNIFLFRSFKKALSSKATYLILAAAIGPGLIVNSTLKENFGRARPSQIMQFDGEKQFSRAFAISDQCESNCSFSSGHAAMAFYFTALAFIAPAAYSNLIYLVALLFGFLVGYVRIIMGGHFASDVLASALIVILVNYYMYSIWQRLQK